MKTTKPLYLRILLAVGMATFPWTAGADTTDQKW